MSDLPWPPFGRWRGRFVRHRNRTLHGNNQDVDETLGRGRGFAARHQRAALEQVLLAGLIFFAEGGNDGLTGALLLPALLLRFLSLLSGLSLGRPRGSNQGGGPKRLERTAAISRRSRLASKCVKGSVVH